MDFLRDEQLYEKHRGIVDYTVLSLAAQDGGGSTFEMAEKLWRMGIGNARHNNPSELSYSTTGAVVRSALARMYFERLVIDYCDFPRLLGINSPPDKRPWNHVATRRGRKRLAQLEAGSNEEIHEDVRR